MRKISWITQESFIDVDIPVIHYLKKWYEFRLIIVMPTGKTIDYDDYVSSILGDFQHIDVEYVYMNSRARSLTNISCYYNIISKAKAFAPDLYYISFTGIPYGLLLYWMMLPIDKCVLPCHNVSTPKGATNETFAEIYKNLTLKLFHNIQVFSQSQYDILSSKHKGKEILLTYLMLKDYGEPKIKKKNDGKLKFLFFGNIVNYKRVDLLIEAVNILVKRDVKNFNVIIAGKAKEWERYRVKIQYPELFDLRIERIPNEDVADLFAESHYFVMPYQDIAQSGAITVAFRYNVPTIVSDIPQFNEFVREGKTTLVFKSQDAVSLADTMQYAIDHHVEIYDDLCKNQKKFVEEMFADEAIVMKYKSFFDSLLLKNGEK